MTAFCTTAMNVPKTRVVMSTSASVVVTITLSVAWPGEIVSTSPKAMGPLIPPANQMKIDSLTETLALFPQRVMLLVKPTIVMNLPTMTANSSIRMNCHDQSND